MATAYAVKLAEQAADLKARDEEVERLRASYVPPTEEELHQKANDAIASIKARKEAAAAAYPAEFTAALAAYMDYLRPLVKEAIEAAVSEVSDYSVRNPRDSIFISMESFRREEDGCCGIPGDGAYLRWEKKGEHHIFSARDLLERTYMFEELGLKDPLTQLKEELEPLGYTVEDGFYIEIPLPSK